RESLAGKSPSGAAAILDGTQALLLARNVIAGHWHDPLPPCELDLKYHHVLLAECHFGSREIKFPHAHEALIIQTLRLLAVGEKAFSPGLQRLCIMQAQNLNIGYQQSGSFYRRQHLRDRWNVAAGKNIFRDPWIGNVRTFRAPDRMQQHDAILVQKLAA